MAWDEQRARDRIRQTKSSQLLDQTAVRGFNEYIVEAAAIFPQREITRSNALIDLPFNKAVLTHGVHVYAKLLNIDSFHLRELTEGEQVHAEKLRFLSAHYRMCDDLVARFGLQRVDFHGGRLHAVVLDPADDGSEFTRIEIAFAFAQALEDAVSKAGDAADGLRTEVSIGMDSGPAVAINSGRKHEAEPLFVGSAANHAARLAQKGIPGIRVTPRVGSILKDRKYKIFAEDIVARESIEQMARSGLNRSRADGQPFEKIVEDFKQDYSFGSLQKRWEDSSSKFAFHRHKPPLSSIDFGDLSPSNSILMEMVSIFADIDGYTSFVDRKMQEGDVRTAVEALHVLRREFANVVRDDFSGKKVRFIGDCIHGLIADGTSYSTDIKASLSRSVAVAGALHSSFEIARAELGTIDDLDLAVGLEMGNTPVSRLGLRGDASVRCATSSSVVASEAMQAKCNAKQTAIGKQAFASSDSRVQNFFRSPETAVPGLTYDTVVKLGIFGSAKPFPKPGLQSSPRPHFSND